MAGLAAIAGVSTPDRVHGGSCDKVVGIRCIVIEVVIPGPVHLPLPLPLRRHRAHYRKILPAKKSFLYGELRSR